MIPTLSSLAAVSAASIGSHFLAQALLVSTPPKDAAGAEALAAAFAPLEARARAAQDQLIAHNAAVAGALSQRKSQVAAVRAAEKAIDSAFASLCDRLLGEVKEGTDGALELVALLCPDGSTVFTRLAGRPQLAAYLVWLRAATSEAAKANPAYGSVADKIAAFQSRVVSFEALIQEKDRLSAAVNAARVERDAAQAEWTLAFHALLSAAALLQGEDSAAFRSWIKPLSDLRAAQAAARTRRANAQPAPVEQPPADPIPADAIPAEIVVDTGTGG